MIVRLQVYMRKGRLLLSLQAVKHALKLAGPAHPDVHRLVVQLCKAVQQRQPHSGNVQVCASSPCGQLCSNVQQWQTQRHTAYTLALLCERGAHSTESIRRYQGNNDPQCCGN